MSLRSNNRGLLFDGKCSYDVVYHTLTHDSGPYSDDTCHHPRDLTSSQFRDIHREQIETEIKKVEKIKQSPELAHYNREILNAILEKSTQHELPEGSAKYWTFLNIPKEYRNQYNLFRQCDHGQPIIVKRLTQEYNNMILSGITKYP